MWTDFDKCDNLSKRNVKLILKVLSDLEPLRGSSNKKTLYSTRSCVNWAFFGTRGPLKRSFHSRFKMAHACQKRPNVHTNSSNKLLLLNWAENVYWQKLILAKVVRSMMSGRIQCNVVCKNFSFSFHNLLIINSFRFQECLHLLWNCFGRLET
jgi:hypothetical protein